ncbi:MAG: hypothetical protein Q3985_06380 [Eubacteriales bacterium]|nr:hypothetical protein [Eubacteriales bacterium]
MKYDEFGSLPDEFGQIPDEFEKRMDEFPKADEDFRVGNEFYKFSDSGYTDDFGEEHASRRKRRTVRMMSQAKSTAVHAMAGIIAATMMITVVTGEVPFEGFGGVLNAEPLAISEEIGWNSSTDEPGSSEPEKETGAENAAESEPEVVLIDCPDCNGYGIRCPGDPTFGYDRGNGQGYAGCGGSGYSPCPDIWCVSGVRKCDFCNGSGLDGTEPCRVCGGTGIGDCEFCGNTGIAPCISADFHYPCDTCGGTGKIETSLQSQA